MYLGADSHDNLVHFCGTDETKNEITEKKEIKEKKEKEYTLEDYSTLKVEEYELKQKLNNKTTEIDDVKTYVNQIIHGNIHGMIHEIEYSDYNHNEVRVVVQFFTLSDLEKLKNVLNLKDIKVMKHKKGFELVLFYD